MSANVVVVGVDGSIPSMAAANWAAQQAELRHVPLRLVCAFVVPIVGQPEYEYPPEFVEAARTARLGVLDRVGAELSGLHPDLQISTSLADTDARRALVAASTEACLTVVGSRGSGRLVEVLLGSVARHVAAHAHSPVAVVPQGLPYPDQPVLVGVDGSPTSHAAIGHAFDEAAMRGVGLVAIFAWDDAVLPQTTRRPVAPDVAEGEEVRALLSEQLAGWRERYPDVVVRQVIYRGQSAAALLRYGQHGPPEQSPQLIVVGSRGRGGFSSLLLGSTSQALISHAICPIIVVRSAQTA